MKISFHEGSVQYILFCNFGWVKGNSSFIRGLPFYIGFPPSKAGEGGSLYKTLSPLYFSRLSCLFLTTITC